MNTARRQRVQLQQQEEISRKAQVERDAWWAERAISEATQDLCSAQQHLHRLVEDVRHRQQSWQDSVNPGAVRVIKLNGQVHEALEAALAVITLAAIEIKADEFPSATSLHRVVRAIQGNRRDRS